ncbi:caspase family protein [Frigidibacter sp. ROC022]|uniref:caspase family protein n=1 Tax=Frigidibacter sp. ROC022 TaxID=2971796 RepID=UPI00215ADC3C|nr:caspase family protein [Frigidibacter sp. ROC022]MCR8722887.1 caspase family protein [Frigidibacter sp. ROC022]
MRRLPGIFTRLQIAVGLVWIGLAGPALAETRAAFIVGNAAYKNAGSLKNPVADARLIAATLTDLGFDVDAHENLTRAGMADALSAFLRNNADADVTLFYYAGHGMQFDGRNYLIGTDAALRSEFDIDSEAINLDKVVDLIQRNSRAALVFVDACRDNPLADRFYRENFSETRAAMTRGLAPMKTGSDGAMVVFSASPGQVAYDGEGGNSTFAEALARHLPAENVEVLSLMKRVIGDVKRGTGELQVPVVTNDLVTEIYLRLGEGGEGAALAMKAEQAVFDAAMEIGTRRAWDIYLRRFPDGHLRDLALAERDRMAVVELASASGTEVKPGERVELSRQVVEREEARLGLSQEEIRAVQEALSSRGYEAGTPDGRMGPRTRQAIADFQASVQLPITGIVTEATAAALGIELETAESGTVAVASSRNARRYDPDKLALIETDKRLIAAARALKDKEFVYGFYDGRIYIALLQWCCDNWEQAKATAARAGGHLATLTSPEENSFVYGLVADDDRFWLRHGDEWVTGPTIGLYQLPGAREPDGGWVWVTGEASDWLNWQPPFPNNNQGIANIGGYGHHPPGTKDFKGSKEFGHWDDYTEVSRSYIIEIE